METRTRPMHISSLINPMFLPGASGGNATQRRRRDQDDRSHESWLRSSLPLARSTRLISGPAVPHRGQTAVQAHVEKKRLVPSSSILAETRT